MRGLLLLCFVAAATAAKLGYNYNKPRQDFAGLIDAEAAGFRRSEPEQPEEAQQADEFSKEFFTYSAPEEDFAETAATQQLASMLKRNLRVLFIKSPEHQGLTKAALQLAKQASEQHTAIYVLSKQTDISELAQRLQTAGQQQAPKPEVHFVKYRTPEDAMRAQQLIQQQFESLGGSSRSHNEGVAPVLDFTQPQEQEEQELPSQPQSTYLPAARRQRS